MRPGRELDCAIAQQVFDYPVSVKKKVLVELTPKGERPLREYTKEIEWAFEVAKKMNISLISIEGDQWFAMVGENKGWSGPAEFIQYLQKGEFVHSGAAVGESAPLAICLAALKALDCRQAAAESGLQ